MWKANVCYGLLLALASGLNCSVDSEVERFSTLSVLIVQHNYHKVLQSSCIDFGQRVDV